MAKIVVLSTFLILLVSCRGDRKEEASDNTLGFELHTEDWAKKKDPNSKSDELIKNWEAFKIFQIGFDAIYNVGNTEDLSLVLEDLIEKQKLLQESSYPEELDKAQIKSRQKVFHTYLLKTKGDLIYGIDPKQSVSEMIDAYNAIIDQMNSITSNTLDLKTILEEESKASE